MTHALVTYHSVSGKTKRMAEAIARGIQEAGGSVMLRESKRTVNKDLLEADCIVLGSPTYFRLPSAEIKRIVDASVVVYEKLNGKMGGMFTSSGGKADGEKCLEAFREILDCHGMTVIGNGVLAVGSVDKTDMDRCLEYGRELGRAMLGDQGE